MSTGRVLQLRLLAWAALVGGVCLWAMFGNVQPAAYAPAERPAAPGSVADIMQGRVCWRSHEARMRLEDKHGRALLANAVIVLDPRGDPVLTRNPRLIGAAIEQGVQGVDRGLAVFAFCQLRRGE